MILHNKFQLISIKSNKQNLLVFSAFLIVSLFFIQKHPRDKNNVKNTHLEFTNQLFNNSNQKYIPLYDQNCHGSKIKLQIETNLRKIGKYITKTGVFPIKTDSKIKLSIYTYSE